MTKKKIFDMTGTLLLFTGFSLAFLPHALHAKIGLDDDNSHIKHVVAGMIIVVIALMALAYNSKALGKPKKFLK